MAGHCCVRELTSGTDNPWLLHHLQPCGFGESKWPFVAAFRVPAPRTQPTEDPTLPLPFLHSVASEPSWAPFEDETLCKIKVHAALDSGMRRPMVCGLVFSLKFTAQRKGGNKDATICASILDWSTGEVLLSCRHLWWNGELQEIGTLSLAQVPELFCSPGVRVRLSLDESVGTAAETLACDRAIQRPEPHSDA